MQPYIRILFCRVAFLCCVLLPTLVVATWAVQRAQPHYRNKSQAEWQQQLAQCMGAKASITSVDYPAYWVARINGLELSDLETHAKLLYCRSLEATRTKTVWIVEASQPEIEIAQLASIWDLIEGRLLREFTPDQLPCEIEVGELTLRIGEQAQTVTQVFASLRPIPNGSELQLEFRLAGVDMPHPCRLTIRRKRDTSPPITQWEFDTAGIALPCALLSARVPSLAVLGKDARFIGTARGEVKPTSVSGELNGRMMQVDLATLVTENSAHRLTGFADIICQLRYQDGRITEIQGVLDCRGGYISESLIAAAREHLRLGIDGEEPLPVQDGLTAYRRLAAEFQLTAAGLRIKGIADPTRAGVVLANGSRAILLDPTESTLSPLALLRTLIPHAELQIPAAKESLPLLQLLPTNSVSPTTQEPRVKVRLAP